MQAILLIPLGYLSGSIPTAIIISRLKGINIREVGSGNPGAANVFREVGKIWGLLVFLSDALKGIIPMFIADRILEIPAYGIHHHFWVGLIGVAAVAGHCWSVFLNFKGGKGLATTGGVLLYLFPWFFPVGMAAYFIMQRSPRNPKLIIPVFLTVFGILVFIYRSEIKWLLPFLVIFLTVSLTANKQALKEIREAAGETDSKEDL